MTQGGAWGEAGSMALSLQQKYTRCFADSSMFLLCQRCWVRDSFSVGSYFLEVTAWHAGLVSSHPWGNTVSLKHHVRAEAYVTQTGL